MNWLSQCDQEAKQLTQGKRQQFLDAIWRGNTLDQARESTGISFNAANGIMRMNISKLDYLQRKSD